MDDSVLWVVALGVGALGFLLIAIAGLVAMYLNTRTPGVGDAAAPQSRKPRTKNTSPAERPQPHAEEATPAGAPQPQAEDVAAAERPRSHPDSSQTMRKTPGGFWAWVKAWIFAVAHAGTVSLVLGGVTLFEDLANASDEIQRTGTVTFPKQLLPRALTGPTSRKYLSQPSGGLLGQGQRRGADQPDEEDKEASGTGDSDQPTGSSPGASGWEVVDLASEAGAAPGRETEDPAPTA